MKKLLLITVWLLCIQPSFPWGFYAHKQINYYAVFMLPPEMLVLYKTNIQFLSDHAVDPDKRRYAVAGEGARHYIDIDHYGVYPFDSLPRNWHKALEKYGRDTLQKYGIVPWHIQTMLFRLTAAFKEKDQVRILKLSADIGHYIGDAHVPLHVCSNHNGQLTNQHGIHAFWESRIPELLAASSWDFMIGKAEYISNPVSFTWKRVLESAAAADSVLRIEKELTTRFSGDQKYSFEPRNGQAIRQYSTRYCLAYNQELNNMIERRMRQSIAAVASFWYTAWVNAGQPDLKQLINKNFSEQDRREFDKLNAAWLSRQANGKDCD
ncbi:zinc dependent phospholipase C family protein [Niastella populi]|uniref:S1/P1 Nuclease n=1 Tax=Niastella populi TaxID=550983 RepID=A0A1V9FJD9_9BACT|nr:zinc dependent phospholipase C family protein [Niastella populi]OQP58475.1 S1/P1 Nuclease [Niastella populi]